MNKHFITILLLFVGSYCQSKQLDSLRLEAIKGQKYVIHLVEKGETLETLVSRYKSSLELIIKTNELKSKQLIKKQILKIPLIPIDSTQSKTSTPTKPDSLGAINDAHANAQTKEVVKTLTHQVIAGETINTIAKKYKLATAQLIKWNNIKNNKIAIGQVLIVDENAAVKPYLRLNKAESQLPITQQIRKIESTNQVKDSGMVIFDETGQVAHASLPIGTIVKVINLENNTECLVRVTKNINQETYKNFVLVLGADVQVKLQTNSPILKVKLEFIGTQ